MLDRRAFRDDVVTRLKAAAVVPAERVYPTRTPPLRIEKLPAVCVYTLEERGVSIAEGGHPVFRNTLTLAIEVVTTAEKDEELDEACDDLCEKVERALLNDPKFGEPFEQIGAFNTEIALGEEGEKRFICARLVFDLTYVTEYPPTLGEDSNFGGVNVRIDARDPADPNLAKPGPDGRVEAGADINVETEE